MPNTKYFYTESKQISKNLFVNSKPKNAEISKMIFLRFYLLHLRKQMHFLAFTCFFRTHYVSKCFMPIIFYKYPVKVTLLQLIHIHPFIDLPQISKHLRSCH